MSTQQLSLNINVCSSNIDNIIKAKTPTSNDSDNLFSNIILSDILLSSEMFPNNIHPSCVFIFNRRIQYINIAVGLCGCLDESVFTAFLSQTLLYIYQITKIGLIRAKNLHLSWKTIKWIYYEK